MYLAGGLYYKTLRLRKVWQRTDLVVSKCLILLVTSTLDMKNTGLVRSPYIANIYIFYKQAPGACTIKPLRDSLVGSHEYVQGYFRFFFPISTDLRFPKKGLKGLKHVCKPSLGFLRLSPSLSLNFSPKQLRDSHLRWFITSVDGYPFFFYFFIWTF